MVSTFFLHDSNIPILFDVILQYILKLLFLTIALFSKVPIFFVIETAMQLISTLVRCKFEVTAPPSQIRSRTQEMLYPNEKSLHYY